MGLSTSEPRVTGNPDFGLVRGFLISLAGGGRGTDEDEDADADDDVDEPSNFTARWGEAKVTVSS